MTDDLDGCLRGRVAAATIDTPADWVTTWFALVAEGHTPIGLAIRGGFAADRVGWAFSAGYQAALRALVANAAPREVLALCVTEAGGNRPRDIATTVQRAGAGRLLVTGGKRWSTRAPLANRLLVVGVDETGAGQEAGRSRLDARPSLVAVSVPAQSAGVSIRAMPETAF